MSEMALAQQSSVDSTPLNATSGTLARVAKYTVVRAILLCIMVAVAVYLTILVANMGGYVDEIIKADIDWGLGHVVSAMEGLSAEEKVEVFERIREQAYEAAGLYVPFMVRCFRWLRQALTLDLGESTSWRVLVKGRYSREVPVLIQDSLPRTLLIFGTANLVLFFTSIGLALALTRKHGGWRDKLITSLSPLSAAPAWTYGIILNVIFLRVMSSLVSGGTFDAWPREFSLAYLPMILRHMFLPFLSIFLSGFFQSVYAWRMLFLLYSSEDHVEMAKARGLSSRMIERRYILRPGLPAVITSFGLMLVVLWQDVIALEKFFNVQGVGRLFYQALRGFDMPVILGVVVTFAYLLAITVFIMDILYALVDPRVRVGSEGRTVRLASRKGKRGLRFWRSWKPLSVRSRPQSQDTRWRSSRTAIGSQVLEQILGSFLAVEDVHSEWLVEPGTGRRLVVDRLYPELGIAIRFTNARHSTDKVYAQAWRQAGVAVIEMDPDRPLSPSTLQEMRAGLSAAARRIAQGQGAREAKLVLLPRIASAKAACQECLDGLDADARPLPAQEAGRWNPWKGRSSQIKGLWRPLSNLKPMLREIATYPSAVAGLVIIIGLIAVSIYTVIAIPYDEAIRRWRGDENVWYRNPTKAPPAWINLFRKEDLPETIVLNSRDGTASKSATAVTDEMTEIAISFTFDYPYGGFPQDLAVYIDAQYEEKRPLLNLYWLTPDGREIELGMSAMPSPEKYLLSQDKRLQRRLDEERLQRALFSDPASETPVPLKGTYELRASGVFFEEVADLDAELVLYGQVYGLAGTDHRRRDLTLGLLWGMPVALSFGLLAAVGTSVSTLVIAAVGTWFGGWVDNLIQRITEVNLILPFLPVSIMVYTLYSKSFWVILGVTVLLSIFGAGIKNFRAIFLQLKEAPYIEAARAYGASARRIIFRYLVPRIGALLIPQLVILIPGYVFLEATLAFLEVSDPILPTWGKMIVDALSYGAYTGDYHMVLGPAALLMLTAVAFLMLGFTLERIFDPRLRER